MASRSVCTQFVRWYAKTNVPSAFSSELKKINKPTPRLVKIRNQKAVCLNQIAEIDETFQVFDKSVKRVVSLGSSPGIWAQFAKDRIFSIHHLQDVSFRQEGFIVGVDILNTIPPYGTSSIQGNVLSNMIRRRVIDQCKELTLRMKLVYQLAEDDSSYVKEQKEEVAHKQVESLEESTPVGQTDHKVDLLLSDLTLALPQETGFWNNTMTKPFMRLAATGLQHKSRKTSTSDVTGDSDLSEVTVRKSVVDMGDASLVYAIDLLRENGTMVLRLHGIQPGDELPLLEERLGNVFRLVEKMKGEDTFVGSEIFYICKGKDDLVDKVSAFTVTGKLKPKL